MKRIDRENEPSIFSVSDEDMGITQAIQNARKNFFQFEDVLINRTDEIFSLKISFDTDNGTEHIWLLNIFQESDKLYGTIDNIPNGKINFKFGDIIEISKDKISDWLIIKNEKLFGGFTIKEIRNRMSEEERIEFDKSLNFIIE